MRCANNRKASLSISTNAIVILIVAVIMLGLIIGLVTRGFSAVERQFLGQIEENEPRPPSPSASQPITLSTGAKITSAGELVGFKINILNTNQHQWLKPEALCQAGGTGPGLSNHQAIGKQLNVSEIGSYLYMFEIDDNAQQGVYLCQMVAYNSSDDTTYDRDTSITPTEFKLTIE